MRWNAIVHFSSCDWFSQFFHSDSLDFSDLSKFHALHWFIVLLGHIPISREQKKKKKQSAKEEEILMSCGESSSWMQDNQHTEQDTRTKIKTSVLSILLTGRPLFQSIHFTTTMSPVWAFPELQTDCTPANSHLPGTDPSWLTAWWIHNNETLQIQEATQY